jgi:hypothetical protein
VPGHTEFMVCRYSPAYIDNESPEEIFRNGRERDTHAVPILACMGTHACGETAPRENGTVLRDPKTERKRGRT